MNACSGTGVTFETGVTPVTESRYAATLDAKRIDPSATAGLVADVLDKI